MASEKQIEANRRNAQLSTGPTTPEGKAAVARNALKHGLRSNKVLYAGEDQEFVDTLREGFVAEYQPETQTEWALIERMAIALHKLYCFEELEQEWEVRFDQNIYPRNAQLLWRRQDSLERSFHRALNTLLKLRKQRAAEAKAAGKTAGPEAAETVTSPEPASAPQPVPPARPLEPEVPPEPGNPVALDVPELPDLAPRT